MSPLSSLISLGGGISSKAVLQAALGSSAIEYDVMPILNTSADFQTVASGLRADSTPNAFILIPGNGGSTSNLAPTPANFTSTGISSETNYSMFYGSSMRFSNGGMPGPVRDSRFYIGGTRQLTLEGWWMFDNAGYENRFDYLYNYLWSQYGWSDANGDEAWEIILWENKPTLVTYPGENTYQSSLALSDNTWYHIAVVFNNNNAKIFVDGNNVLDTTFTTPGTGDINDYPQTFTIGAIFYDEPTYSPLNGRVQDLRAYEYAKYSANFTIPPKS